MPESIAYDIALLSALFIRLSRCRMRFDLSMLRDLLEVMALLGAANALDCRCGSCRELGLCLLRLLGLNCTWFGKRSSANLKRSQ